MKRCPECRRDYYDDTLAFCLEDGTALVQGSVPAPLESSDEPQTAILPETSPPSEAGTRAQIHTTERTAALPGGTSGEARREGFDKRLIVAPLAVLVLVLAGFFGYRYFSTGSKQIESIAVMPFVNESKNPDVEYLSDGMTETLISSLSQLPNLNVKGRASVFRYKGTDLGTKALGHELGVQAILYGRVVQRGDQLTLSLELLDAVTENVVWSGKYDRKQGDVVALQTEIARDTSNKLRAKLSGAEQNQIAKNYTTNAEAYQLYLKGRYYWNKRTEADIKRSLDYFNQAIALDPSYALAYAGIADAYQVLPNLPGMSSEDAYPKARDAAQKALDIDPNISEPHAALGVVLHEYDWKFGEAEKSFKRSIELNPNYASAHQWYGEYLMNMGRYDEAIAETKLAHQLDPLSLIINVVLGRAYYAAHRYEEAISQFRKVFEVHPSHPATSFRLIDVYCEKGMFEEAIEERRKFGILVGAPAERVEKRMTALREAYRKAGPRGYWETLLEYEQENARERNREISPVELARFQVRLGMNEQALDLLEKSFESGKRDLYLVRLKSEPVWQPLQSERRFTELLRKIGLPE